jgi:hypothetical protein
MGRAACEACSATWSLGTNSAFALGSRKTTENLDRVGSLISYSLYILGTDRIENTSANRSPVAVSRSSLTDQIENTTFQLLHCCVLQICCPVTDVFAESFPSNGCFSWLHSSCLEHNIFMVVKYRSYLQTFPPGVS